MTEQDKAIILMLAIMRGRFIIANMHMDTAMRWLLRGKISSSRQAIEKAHTIVQMT